ncbi:DUF1028 domain-containing protein [Salarchaeum japonicum]|nr:DUF1028 domain-containing protein [Salarchaeum japonicum]
MIFSIVARDPGTGAVGVAVWHGLSRLDRK